MNSPATRCTDCRWPDKCALARSCYWPKQDKRAEQDAEARGLHAAQFRHDMRCKIGAERYL